MQTSIWMTEGEGTGVCGLIWEWFSAGRNLFRLALSLSSSISLEQRQVFAIPLCTFCIAEAMFVCNVLSYYYIYVRCISNERWRVWVFLP